jgi:hypothetical protein
VSATVGARRDSALAARGRAVQAGALKNNTPSMVLGETMLQASERELQGGNEARAVTGYVAVVEQYRRAQLEAAALGVEARQTLDRVTPVVQAIPTGPNAANAAVTYARAESLFREKDFTLAKLAAQSAEQIGIDAGIAPPSSQPAGAREAVEVLLSDLARALASERVGNIRVLYPRLTDRERTGWEMFFHDWDQITARFTIDQFAQRGTTASAEVRAVFEYVPSGGGAPRLDRRGFSMRFEKRPVGWRLSAVSEAP